LAGRDDRFGRLQPHEADADARALDRYLNDKERTLLTELRDLVKVKDELDTQYTGQSLLKYWLFLHIPLTYVILLFAIPHMVMVLSFLNDVR